MDFLEFCGIVIIWNFVNICEIEYVRLAVVGERVIQANNIGFFELFLLLLSHGIRQTHCEKQRQKEQKEGFHYGLNLHKIMVIYES